jgi:hypothetical protein
VLDSLIVSLSKYTAALNPASPRAAVVFGNDEKARLATSTLFELVNRCCSAALCHLPSSSIPKGMQSSSGITCDPETTLTPCSVCRQSSTPEKLT